MNLGNYPKISLINGSMLIELFPFCAMSVLRNCVFALFSAFNSSIFCMQMVYWYFPFAFEGRCLFIKYLQFLMITTCNVLMYS